MFSDTHSASIFSSFKDYPQISHPAPSNRDEVTGQVRYKKDFPRKNPFFFPCTTVIAQTLLCLKICNTGPYPMETVLFDLLLMRKSISFSSLQMWADAPQINEPILTTGIEWTGNTSKECSQGSIVSAIPDVLDLLAHVARTVWVIKTVNLNATFPVT